MKDDELTKELTYKQDANKRIALVSRINTLEAIQLTEKDPDKWLARQETIEELAYKVQSIDAYRQSITKPSHPMKI